MRREEFEKALKDYRLTTAEIFYRFPDYPKLLQTFVWQELDLAPKFPELNKFLGFWESELEGKLHSVSVTHAELATPHEIVWRGGSVKLH